MYKTADITLDALKAVKINNQREILRLLGSKLSLVTAWEEVKRVSNNFTKKVTEAIQADTLLYELVQPEKGTSVTETKDQARIRIRERERLRKIKILALELEMSNTLKK
ncbi:hypothetical protein U8527_10400 [Kordia algicida OT-1]|uniref:Uncharacterized protein n=1 Tax=Kordia algicida OT-1 TaxID=391587 RepID=A9DW65_9FLAO|nr:hypothetical protein [Kordia algicida]EDP96516.1 hypothetical protein KAOT1_03867 [Kordia algicida OT-1]